MAPLARRNAMRVSSTSATLWLDAPPLESGLGLALQTALLCAAYYLGTAAGYALILPESHISVVWPPNTVLLVAFLLSPPRRWPWILAIALPVHLAAHTHFGGSASTAALYYVFNCMIVL